MENQVYSMPRIGDKAPSFKAKTTQGEINFPGDFGGKWKILFSQIGRASCRERVCHEV